MNSNTFKSWEIEQIDFDSENSRKISEKFLHSLSDQKRNFIEKNIDSLSNEEKIIKSPMTIVDGNWGSGKTYFIEKTIENFDDIIQNNKDIIFKNIVYIDALEIIEDENIVYDFLYQLLSKSEKFKKLSLDTINWVSKSFLNSVISAVNGLPIFDIDKIEKGKINKFDFDELNKMNNKENLFDGESIVFIDNLERIGKDSKKIIQLVYKLRKINNVTFVLVTNVKKISFNEEIKNDNEEYPIYKFTNLKTYKFNQDYKSMIKNNDHKNILKESDLTIINNILNNSTMNEQISIRQLLRWIFENNFYDEESEIERYKMVNNISKANVLNIFTNEYKNEIEKYWNSLSKLFDIFNGIKALYSKTDFNNLENHTVDYDGYIRIRRPNQRIEDFAYITKKGVEINSNFDGTWRTNSNEFVNRQSLSEKTVESVAKKVINIYDFDQLINEFNLEIVSDINLSEITKLNFEISKFDQSIFLFKKYFEKLKFLSEKINDKFVENEINEQIKSKEIEAQDEKIELLYNQSTALFHQLDENLEEIKNLKISEMTQEEIDDESDRIDSEIEYESSKIIKLRKELEEIKWKNSYLKSVFDLWEIDLIEETINNFEKNYFSMNKEINNLIIVNSSNEDENDERILSENVINDRKEEFKEKLTDYIFNKK